MTFPSAIVDAMPSDNEMVLGTVATLNPLTVNVRGGVINNPGVLGSYIPGVGDPVQLMRQGATWLILGPSGSSADASNSVNGFNNNTAVAATAAGAYTNVNPAFFTFVKRFPSTAVKIEMSCSCFLTVAVNTKPRFGLDFLSTSGGTNSRFTIMEMLINPLSTHTSFSATTKLTGIGAGTYTVQLLWLVAAGAGQLNINADDWVSVFATEVA